MKSIFRNGLVVAVALLISANAATTQEQLIQTAQATDSLVQQKDLRTTSIDNYGHSEQILTRGATIQAYAAHLAPFLGLTEKKLESLLKKKQSISGIALAQMVAKKEGESFDAVYQRRTITQWIELLKVKNISLSEAKGILDNIYTEAAVVSIDAQMKPLAQAPANKSGRVQIATAIH